MRLFVLLLAAGALHAQASPAARFSVASIRPCRANDPSAARGSKGGNGGRSNSPVTFNLPCLPLRFYINLAYVISSPATAVNPNPVLEGGPDWIDSTETALAKLGLRLERINAPREFLIVDHVERPSGN